MNTSPMKLNPLLRTQLDIYCLNLRFNYSDKYVDTFFDKVFHALAVDETNKLEHGNIIILRLIASAHNSIERKLLKGFLDYIESYHKTY